MTGTHVHVKTLRCLTWFCLLWGPLLTHVGANAEPCHYCRSSLRLSVESLRGCMPHFRAMAVFLVMFVYLPRPLLSTVGPGHSVWFWTLILFPSESQPDGEPPAPPNPVPSANWSVPGKAVPRRLCAEGPRRHGDRRWLQAPELLRALPLVWVL